MTGSMCRPAPTADIAAGDHARWRAPAGRRRRSSPSCWRSTGKLMVKDQLTRDGPAGFAKQTDHMGVGLVGRTLGSIGIGNIGAELFRLAKPFDMKFIAHDPYRRCQGGAAELGIELVGLEDVFRRADFVTVNCPLTAETRHLVNAERLALMKPTAYPHQYRARSDRRSEGADQGAAGAPHRRRRARRARDRSRPMPTIPSSSSTMSSWRRMRCAGPISASPATAPPMCGRCSTCSRARSRAASSTGRFWSRRASRTRLESFRSSFGKTCKPGTRRQDIRQRELNE